MEKNSDSEEEYGDIIIYGNKIYKVNNINEKYNLNNKKKIDFKKVELDIGEINIDNKNNEETRTVIRLLSMDKCSLTETSWYQLPQRDSQDSRDALAKYIDSLKYNNKGDIIYLHNGDQEDRKKNINPIFKTKINEIEFEIGKIDIDNKKTITFIRWSNKINNSKDNDIFSTSEWYQLPQRDSQDSQKALANYIDSLK